LSVARRGIRAGIKFTSKITNPDSFTGTGFLSRRILNDLGRKGNMLRARRTMLALAEKLPRGKFFLTPFVPFFEPVSPTISPEMEVTIKMLSYDMLKLTNGEVYMFGCHRELVMAILNTSHMKSDRHTSKNGMKD
jgi:hypothetical protein